MWPDIILDWQQSSYFNRNPSPWVTRPFLLIFEPSFVLPHADLHALPTLTYINLCSRFVHYSQASLEQGLRVQGLINHTLSKQQRIIINSAWTLCFKHFDHIPPPSRRHTQTLAQAYSWTDSPIVNKVCAASAYSIPRKTRTCGVWERKRKSSDSKTEECDGAHVYETKVLTHHSFGYTHRLFFFFF